MQKFTANHIANMDLEGSFIALALGKVSSFDITTHWEKRQQAAAVQELAEIPTHLKSREPRGLRQLAAALTRAIE